MAIPGSLRDTQIWIAVERSTGSSSDPALIVRLADWLSDSCQSREPQFGQKAHFNLRPLSVPRVQNFGSPRINRNPLRGTSNDKPNAEADCFWHSRQWQM
jgi:hypothetical protein